MRGGRALLAVEACRAVLAGKARQAFLAATLALAGSAVLLRSSPTAAPFDHAEHAGLFVSCESCHAGIASGDESGWLTVTPADCERCHDGAREERVAWVPPSPRPTNLDFSHAGHAAEVAAAGREPTPCAACHGVEGGRLMDVAAAPPEPCLSCHAELPGRGPAVPHLAGADCAECHPPLTAATGIGVARIAVFPRPPDHEAPGFLLGHGEEGGAAGASCAVCHARPSCERCHLNADRVPAIALLAPDPRVAALTAGLEGEWAEPADHDVADFLFDHGGRPLESCATCHAASSCETCHRDAASWLADLPRPSGDAPRGAGIERRRPPGHTVRFAEEHASAAGARLPACESCHAPAECADCHAPAAAAAAGPPDIGPTDLGAESGELGYHVAGFVLRHGAEAFGVQAGCSDCHSTEAFCRDCHASLGVSIGRGEGGLGAFHDARQSWLIGHGASARMGLEACAACHEQTSCLRCHSARSGLRINPHGPGFRPERLAARSTISCAICHTATQIPPP